MLYTILFCTVALGLATWAFVRGYQSPDSPVSTPTRTKCSVCGTSCIDVDGQYCSYECRDRLAKNMDDWHDQFEDRFPDDK